MQVVTKSELPPCDPECPDSLNLPKQSWVKSSPASSNPRVQISTGRRSSHSFLKVFSNLDEFCDLQKKPRHQYWNKHFTIKPIIIPKIITHCHTRKAQALHFISVNERQIWLVIS